ncbi:uncharacterized protein LOC110464015 [Mizuhopecten yessoensis]|uniref:uncharacterized protein LOC110464015 n=1 Tax=Mizuhopecten yessoensis TaxID=6573 RepID=UPI000B45719B|nr:uncharacterized protein LOC110464015 [Mizuhopecten yessoensis]XP_021374699.1 uncharacterized protein LOC110464015 [Mizuhopecten yessoensis]
MATKTTFFFKGQMPVRTKGQIHCTFHSEKIFQLYCITCQELACIKCVSTIHRGHNLDDLQDLTPQKKGKIRNFIDTSESTKSNEFQQNLASVDQKLSENADNFEKLCIAAKAHAEKLKKEINDYTLTKISIFREIKEENEKLLSQYKEDIYRRKERFCNFLKECKESVQTGSDIQIHDTEKEVDTHMYNTPPSVPAVQHVSFRPNLYPLQSIEHAFGLVTTERKASENMLKDSSGSQPCKICPANTKFDKAAATNPHITKHKRAPRMLATRKKENDLGKPLLPQDQHRKTRCQTTKILADFQSPFAVLDMSVIGEEAWTCCACYDNITLISNKGEKKRNVTLTLTSYVMGISVSPTTHHCWAHSYDGKIVEVTPTKVIHRFNTTINKLHSICVTLDEHILIGGPGALTKLTTNGKTVFKTTTSSSGQPLCVSPCRMSECRITGNIAMVDGDHVLVIDKHFQQLFMYKGAMSTVDQSKVSKAWSPEDVAYDNTGNLVVCDRNTIFLISNEGMFLRQLFSDTSAYIHCVCIEETGTLWFGSYDFHVRLLQYT